MRHGLPDETVRDLRQRYPRSQKAELISRIAAFPRECFASAKYLGDQIGRSKRQVFRYFRDLKDEGVIERIPGNRRELPQDSTPRGRLALVSHGYAYTQFRGALAPMVHQGISLVRSRRRRHEIARERREEDRRLRRQRQQAEHKAHMAAEHAKWRAEFPDLARREDEATARPRGVPQDTRAGAVFEQVDELARSFDEAIDPDLCDVWLPDDTGPPA